MEPPNLAPRLECSSQVVRDDFDRSLIPPNASIQIPILDGLCDVSGFRSVSPSRSAMVRATLRMRVVALADRPNFSMASEKRLGCFVEWAIFSQLQAGHLGVGMDAVFRKTSRWISRGALMRSRIALEGSRAHCPRSLSTSSGPSM